MDLSGSNKGLTFLPQVGTLRWKWGTKLTGGPYIYMRIVIILKKHKFFQKKKEKEKEEKMDKHNKLIKSALF